MNEALPPATMNTERAKESRRGGSYKWLPVILLGAFVLRLGFMLQFTPLIRALDSYRPRDFLLAGVLFGLSSLSRPEAFAYPVFIILATGVVAFFRKISWLKALRGAALLFGTWLILMAPYAAFQHRHTGQYRFEGKWNINYTLGNRIDAGMGYFQAGFTMDDKLNMVGPLVDSSIYAAYTPYSRSFSTKLNYFGHAIHRNWLATYDELYSVDIGGPVTIFLVVLGLFGRPWSARRLGHEFILVVMAISIVFLLLTAAHIEHRYAYPLPVIFLLWAAAGLDVFRDWIARTVSLMGTAARPLAAYAAQIALVSACFLLTGFSLLGMRTDWFFMIQQKDFLGIKQAGEWLEAQQPKTKKMLGFEVPVAY